MKGWKTAHGMLWFDIEPGMIFTRNENRDYERWSAPWDKPGVVAFITNVSYNIPGDKEPYVDALVAGERYTAWIVNFYQKWDVA